MALTATQARNALIAFNRFGLGAKKGFGPVQLGADAKAALIAELNTADIALINPAGLPDYVTACRDGQTDFDHADTLRRAEMSARVNKHLAVNIGFVERLVIFWSNHFSMTVNKNDTIRGTIGQWERDVVRANVLGKFVDMLRGTITHPAMISYLDNEDSIGPNSPTGLNWGAGFNENLAREIMELHTLGSGGSPLHYTEADVTAFAKILTGWSFVRAWEVDYHYNGGKESNRGQFIYRSNWHEPGPITLRGKTYPNTGNGKATADQVLTKLAADPATAEHIAFKLVRHFITDEPTPAMVDPLKAAYTSSGGDLKQVALALINLPEAWDLVNYPFTKLRTPYEMTIAQYRAVGKRYDVDNSWVLSEPLYALHQMQWEAPSPKGYYDDTPIWLNPDAMRIRLDLAQFTSWEFLPNYKRSVVQLAVELFDAALSGATKSRIQTMQNSDNYAAKNDALTILLSSPEFQRR